MNYNKINFCDEFFSIESIGFMSDTVLDENGRKKYISYMWVIPVYVYSINNVWDGTKTIDICPVNLKLQSNGKNNYNWRRSVEFGNWN